MRKSLKDARKIVMEAGKITNSYFKQKLIIENKRKRPTIDLLLE